MANISDLIAEQELAELAGRVRSSVWVPAHLWEDALQVAAEAICRTASSNSWRPEVQTAKRDFSAWAYIKARYALLSWVRAETAYPTAYSFEEPTVPIAPSDWRSDPALQTHDDLDAVIIRSDLAGALRALQPIQRELLLMSALGYRRSEMSHRFRMNATQLKERIDEARAAARSLLIDELLIDKAG